MDWWEQRGRGELRGRKLRERVELCIREETKGKERS